MPLPFNNEQIVGTCGLCDGPVVLPIAWWGVIPPVPTCKDCGATAKQDYGPKMPMDPPAKWTTEIQITPPEKLTFYPTNKIEIDPDNFGGLRINPPSTECCVR